MGTKSKCVLSLHGGSVVKTVIKTKLLGGITVLAANLMVGLVITSAVCTDESCSSLNCNVPSGPHVIPNRLREKKSRPKIIPGVNCRQTMNCCLYVSPPMPRSHVRKPIPGIRAPEAVHNWNPTSWDSKGGLPKVQYCSSFMQHRPAPVSIKATLS